MEHEINGRVGQREDGETVNEGGRLAGLTATRASRRTRGGALGARGAAVRGRGRGGDARRSCQIGPEIRRKNARIAPGFFPRPPCWGENMLLIVGGQKAASDGVGAWGRNLDEGARERCGGLSSPSGAGCEHSGTQPSSHLSPNRTPIIALSRCAGASLGCSG